MTNDRMALQALLEKTPDADYLRQMIGFAAQRLMELDIERRAGAGRRFDEGADSGPQAVDGSLGGLTKMRPEGARNVDR